MPNDKLIKKYKAFIGPNKLLDHLFKPQKGSKKRTIDDSSSDVESYTYQQTPPFITGTLRNYQIEGVNWLIQMHALNINCVLADEMGLGKTLQTITFLGHLKEFCKNKRPHLLIVPKSTLHNWKNEFAKFYPTYKLYIFHCSRHEFNKVKIEIKKSKFDIIVTTYEMCITNKILQQYEFDYIIIDEAHRIKNENSKLSQFVRLFKCKHRLLITGTPLQNNVRELWALLNFLVPQLFSDGDVFEDWIASKANEKCNLEVDEKMIEEMPEVIRDISKNDDIGVQVSSALEDESEEVVLSKRNKSGRFARAIERNETEEDTNTRRQKSTRTNDVTNKHGKQDNTIAERDSDETKKTKKQKLHRSENGETTLDENIQQLRKVILPFFLRREKADVETTLKPKKIVNLYPGLSEMQRTWYKNILKKEITGENVLTNKSALMNIVMQLRKVCNHPYLFDGAEPEPFTTDEHLINNSGKMIYLDKLLKKYTEEKCKVLIFSQMTRMLDILEDYCGFRDYEYRRLDGATSLEDRSRGIEEFHSDPNIFIYLLTTRAGGLGINLTAAEIVIIFDSDWNPQMDLQAMDRAHRIGQKREVKVFRLISENTIEEKIIIRCMQKLKLDERLLKNKSTDKLNKDELMNIIATGVEDLQGERKENEYGIDEILKIGEIKTVTLNEKINGKALNEEPDFDYYKWEGEDYKQRVQKLTQFMGFNEKYTGRSRVRHKKQIKLYDFQFHSKELRKLIYKELEKDLSYEEIGRKNELMKEVFDWSHKEFELYLKACENVGKDIDDILDYLFVSGGVDRDNLKNFTPEEVKRFHVVFWKRTGEVSDIEKSLYIIEKTEAKKKKTKSIYNCLNRKFSNIKSDIEAYKRGDLFSSTTHDTDVEINVQGTINKDTYFLNSPENKNWFNKNKETIQEALNQENVVLHLCRNVKLSYSQNTRSKYYTDKNDKLILLLHYLYFDHDNFLEIVERMHMIKWLKFDYHMRTRDEREIGRRLRVIGDLLLKNDANEAKL